LKDVPEYNYFFGYAEFAAYLRSKGHQPSSKTLNEYKKYGLCLECNQPNTGKE
jgi:hypothetical protein